MTENDPTAEDTSQTVTTVEPPEDPGALLGRLEPRFQAILSRYRIPPDDRSDLIQNAALILLRRLDEVDNREAWLVATLRNQCIMYWRSRRRQLHVAVDADTLEAAARAEPPRQESRALRYDLERGLAHLPERCQRLLFLRFGLGYRHGETAAALGYQTSSIGTMRRNCLAALARQLDLGPDEE